MDEEVEKAVESVDEYEEEEAEKRAKEKEEHKEKNEDMVIICPKCKTPVIEGDFDMDEVANMMQGSIMYKISCSKCGYRGLPVEMDREDYKKMEK